MRVAPGTIAVWSGLHCPWAHVPVWRLWDAFGFPVVDAADPTAYDELVRRAAAT